jgi:hypothetical protein
VSRLRGGERLVGAGALALLASLFAPWFGGRGGWSSLGWPGLVAALSALLLAGWLVLATAAGRSVVQAVTAGVLVAVGGSLAALVLLARAVLWAPGALDAGACVGLGGALAIAVGGWWSLADERTDAPESAYEPPSPRPAPPAA